MQTGSQRVLADSNAPIQSAGVVWVRASPSEVMRTVAIALVTAAVVLGAFFLLWQLRTFVGWFVIALFLAAVLNPAVNWLEQRHRLIKRSLAILLVYLALVLGVLLVVGIFVPVLVDQIKGLSDFVVAVAQAPEGPTEYLKGLAQQSSSLPFWWAGCCSESPARCWPCRWRRSSG